MIRPIFSDVERSIVVENLLLILLCLSAGVGLRRIPNFPKDASGAFNAYVIYVALPAIVLVQIPKLQLTRELLVPALMPWAMLGVGAGLVLAAARLWRWPREVTGALLMMVPLANTSFIGFPLVQAWFGEAGMPYAIIYDQLGTFVALTVYGSFILSRYGHGAEPSLRGIMRRIGSFPPFIALVLALAITPFGLPAVAEGVLTRVGATLVPVVMVAVGLQWRLVLPRSVLPPLGFALTAKLVALPLAALGLCYLLGLEGLPAQVSVFEAGMGPMITAGALAMAAGLAPELVAAVLGYGILLSLGTSAVLFSLIGH